MSRHSGHSGSYARGGASHGGSHGRGLSTSSANESLGHGFAQFSQQESLLAQRQFPGQFPNIQQNQFPTEQQAPFRFTTQFPNTMQLSAQAMMNSINMYGNILTDGSGFRPPAAPLNQQHMLDDGAHPNDPIGGRLPPLDTSTPTPDPRYSGTTAGARGQASEQPQRFCDPPSGNDIVPGLRAVLEQKQYESCPPPADKKDEPRHKPGRKATKLSKPIRSYEQRPLVQVCEGKLAFNLADAETVLSAALRVHFRGDKEWDDVCIATKRLMWREFRVRFRWLQEHEAHIMEVWDALCRKRYKTMMYNAKEIYKKGLNEEVSVQKRAKWMEPPYFYICKKRWDSDEDIEYARKMAKNRGVKFDENNNVVSAAPPTWFGGNVSISDRCTQEAEGSTSGKRAKKLKERPVEMNRNSLKLLPHVYKVTHIANIREIRDSEEARSRAEAVDFIGEDGAPIVIPHVEERWANEPSRQLFEGYNQITQQSETSSESVAEFNPALWGKLAGGVKHGRIRGVSGGIIAHTAGFTDRVGRAPPPRPRITSQVDPSEVKKLKKEVRDLKKSQKASNQLLLFMKKWSKTDNAPPELGEIFKSVESFGEEEREVSEDDREDGGEDDPEDDDVEDYEADYSEEVDS